MGIKKTGLMFLALLVLVGLAVLLQSGFFNGDDAEGQVPTVFNAAGVEEITRLEVTSGGEMVTLTRDGDGWTAGRQERAFPANPEAVETALDMFKNLNAGTIASHNPETHASFMVDGEEGVRVTAYAGEEKAADFLVGKQGPDFFSSYIRNAEGDEVILAKGYLRPVFDKRLKDWRDLRIISFDAEKAVSLEIQRPDGSLGLEKGDDGLWMITSPGENPADGEEVDDIITRLSSFKAIDAAEGAEVDHGFDEPSLKVRVGLDDGTTRGIIVGGKAEEKNRYFTRAEDGESVYLIGQYAFKRLDRNLSDLQAEDGAGATPEPAPPAE